MGKITKFLSVLSAKKIIACDTPLFIYQFAKNPKYFPLTNHVFKLLDRQKIKLITSIITLIEVLAQPESLENTRVRERYIIFFDNLSSFKMVDMRRKTAIATAAIRGRYNLKIPDSAQLAAALIEDANIFITNDEKFRKVKEIEVLVLKDYT